MLNRKNNKSRRLSLEILFLVSISLIISLIIFFVMTYSTRGIVEEYLFNNEIVLDDYKYYSIENTIFTCGLIISVIIFIVIFLGLFSGKIAYIKTITNGIKELQINNYDHKVELKGNNELTELANSINFLSKQEKEVKEKEEKLSKEKEELIRNLSHDIRTPLTSIISYTELMSNKENLSNKEKNEYFNLILKKSKQIKDLTDVLLDGNKKELSTFEDATLLIKQLVDEFEDSLESFNINIDLSKLTKFTWTVDVNELIRIFDNLISNIKKYASNEDSIDLIIENTNNSLVITQRNIIKENKDEQEHHNIGISSIKKIVQGYQGNVVINENEKTFEIIITF